MWILVIVGLVLLAAGGVLLWTGRRTQRRVNILKQSVPTPAGNVKDGFPGEIVAVQGVARTERPLTSEHSQTPCVYYSATIQREYETTERTSATRNRPARQSTRRSTETISTNAQHTEFLIEDESGQARVIPDDADFDARETMNRFEPAGQGDGSSISVGSFNINLGGSGNRTIGFRYRESLIPVDTPVFVLGVVSESGDIVKPQSGQENAAFIISHRTADALSESWGSSARWQAYASIGSALVGIVLLLIAAVLALT